LFIKKQWLIGGKITANWRTEDCKENLSYCSFTKTKTHVDYSGIESDPQLQQLAVYQSWLQHGQAQFK
jgi:hypothetical protein